MTCVAAFVPCSVTVWEALRAPALQMRKAEVRDVGTLLGFQQWYVAEAGFRLRLQISSRLSPSTLLVRGVNRMCPGLLRQLVGQTDQ